MEGLLVLIVVIIVIIVLIALVAGFFFNNKNNQQTRTTPCESKTNEWTTVNKDVCNSRSNDGVKNPNKHNVKNLKVLWSTTLPTPQLGVEGAPIIKDNVVYYVDIGGNVFARNLDNGDLLWSVTLTSTETGYIVDAPLVEQDDTIYVIGSDLVLYFLNKADGTVKNTLQVNPGHAP